MFEALLRVPDDSDHVRIQKTSSPKFPWLQMMLGFGRHPRASFSIWPLKFRRALHTSRAAFLHGSHWHFAKSDGAETDLLFFSFLTLAFSFWCTFSFFFSPPSTATTSSALSAIFREYSRGISRRNGWFVRKVRTVGGAGEAHKTIKDGRNGAGIAHTPPCDRDR